MNALKSFIEESDAGGYMSCTFHLPMLLIQPILAFCCNLHKNSNDVHFSSPSSPTPNNKGLVSAFKTPYISVPKTTHMI